MELISYIFQLYESYEIKFPTKISSFTVASNCVRLLIKCGFYTRLKTNIKIISTTHAQCKHYNFFKAYLLWRCPVQLCIHTTISWSLTGPHSLTFFIIFLQRSRDPRQYVKGDSESQTLSAMKESSRQKPRSAMSRKTPGEVRARTCGTKSPSRSEALRFIDSSKSPSTVDGDLDESIKRNASDRLGDLVPQVRARTSPGVFRDMALLGLCLELSFSVLYCRTQANSHSHTVCNAGWIECNRPFAQLLPGLETGHPVTVGQSPT